MPWRLIGETVRATIADGVVRIHHGIHEVAAHPICVGRRRRVVDPKHFEGLAAELLQTARGFKSVMMRVDMTAALGTAIGVGEQSCLSF